jgi:hypothetical protein
MQRGIPPRKWIVRLLIGLVLCSQVAALAGDLALAGIVDRHPALLIALNPRNRNLALATNQLDALTYYSIGFIRLVGSDPLYYLLGFWYGERAIRWAERRSRTYGPFIRDGERLFRGASYPLIFIAPNNIICALSAATGVRLGTFLVLNISGTIARLILVRQLGVVLSSPIEAVVGFIATYRIPILILSAIGVAWTIFGEFRGDNSELQTLRDLEHEAEQGANVEAQATTADNGSPTDSSTPADNGSPSSDRASANGSGPVNEPLDEAVKKREPS